MRLYAHTQEEKRPADFSRWQDRIDAILRQLAVKGLALEINTSGLRQPGGTTHPPLSLVRRFRQLGGEFITIGADAHRPEDVGTGLEQAAALAREAGFTHQAVFFGGKMELLPLE